MSAVGELSRKRFGYRLKEAKKFMLIGHFSFGGF
jgi:hypothetical protein